MIKLQSVKDSRAWSKTAIISVAR